MSGAYQRVKDELKRIAASDPEGKLHAEAVVEAAKDPNSILHGYFEWDDTEAARKWRVHQARSLIRVTVQPYEQIDNQEVRSFVSLVPDRVQGGGYRLTELVLSTDALREQYLDQAKRELVAVRQKYANVQELAKIWRAIDEGVTPKMLEFTHDMKMPETFQ